MAIATVSRLYDDEGRLLYVDMSNIPLQRLAELAKGDPPWWIEVASISMEHFEDRAVARQEARKALATEGPAYRLAPREDER